MKIKFHAIILLATLVLLGSQTVNSQTQIVNFIRGGVEDGEKLIQAYLQPLGNAMGTDLNAGWYNTAKVHSTLGFDVTFTLSAAFVPQTDKTFDLADIGLKTLRIAEPSQPTNTPTFAGSRDKGPWLELAANNPIGGDDLILTRFQAHNGVDIPAYPLPMVKAAIGIPAGIEIMGRFLPRITYEDMSLGMWGAGIKYDVLQHVPVLRKFPILNVSVMGAYTKVNSSSDINFQKSIYGSSHAGIPVVGGKDNYDNQNLEIQMQGFTTMALVSADLPVITFYGGLGYSRSLSTVDLLGDYPLIDSQNIEPGKIPIVDVTDPIALKFTNYSGLQTTIGFKLKVAVITFHADYTYANYNIVSAGLGVSLR